MVDASCEPGEVLLAHSRGPESPDSCGVGGSCSIYTDRAQARGAIDLGGPIQ